MKELNLEPNDKFGEPTINQPDLMRIIEKLRFIVADHSEIVNVTENKLQLIKKFDEFASKPLNQVKSAECAMDEINNLLETLIELNAKAFNNYKNLGEII
jgi:hypothetical protein